MSKEYQDYQESLNQEMKIARVSLEQAIEANDSESFSRLMSQMQDKYSPALIADIINASDPQKGSLLHMAQAQFIKNTDPKTVDRNNAKENNKKTFDITRELMANGANPYVENKGLNSFASMQNRSRDNYVTTLRVKGIFLTKLEKAQNKERDEQKAFGDEMKKDEVEFKRILIGKEKGSNKKIEKSFSELQEESINRAKSRLQSFHKQREATVASMRVTGASDDAIQKYVLEAYTKFTNDQNKRSAPEPNTVSYILANTTENPNPRDFKQEAFDKLVANLSGGIDQDGSRDILRDLKKLMSEKEFTNFINQKGPEGKTLLHLAAENAQTDVVTSLLKKGADVKIKDDKGILAIDAAQNAQTKPDSYKGNDYLEDMKKTRRAFVENLPKEFKLGSLEKLSIEVGRKELEREKGSILPKVAVTTRNEARREAAAEKIHSSINKAEALEAKREDDKAEKAAKEAAKKEAERLKGIIKVKEAEINLKKAEIADIDKQIKGYKKDLDGQFGIQANDQIKVLLGKKKVKEQELIGLEGDLKGLKDQAKGKGKEVSTEQGNNKEASQGFNPVGDSSKPSLSQMSEQAYSSITQAKVGWAAQQGSGRTNPPAPPALTPPPATNPKSTVPTFQPVGKQVETLIEPENIVRSGKGHYQSLPDTQGKSVVTDLADEVTKDPVIQAARSSIRNSQRTDAGQSKGVNKKGHGTIPNPPSAEKGGHVDKLMASRTSVQNGPSNDGKGGRNT